MSAGPLPGPLQNPEDTAPTLGVIVVAAGSSTRMGGIDKSFTPLLGMPLIAHCLDQLETFPPVARITLVLSQQSLGLGEELVAFRVSNWVQCLGVLDHAFTLVVRLTLCSFTLCCTRAHNMGDEPSYTSGSATSDSNNIGPHDSPEKRVGSTLESLLTIFTHRIECTITTCRPCGQ